MKAYAETFYKSRAWKNCAKAYKASKGGLCERCLKSGKISAGAVVHHKIHISQKNINDPTITLNWDNLELLCYDCHAAEHGNKKRYAIDAYGRVITTPDPWSSTGMVDPGVHEEKIISSYPRIFGKICLKPSRSDEIRKSRSRAEWDAWNTIGRPSDRISADGGSGIWTCKHGVWISNAFARWTLEP